MPTGVGWRVVKSLLLELLLSIDRERKEQSTPAEAMACLWTGLSRLGSGLRVGFFYSVLGTLKTVFA